MIIDSRQAGRKFLKSVNDRRFNRVISLNTGFTKINDVMPDGKGFEFHRLWTIGGLSGHGKTTLMSNIERNILNLNPTVNFSILNINLENLVEDLLEKTIMDELQMPLRTLYHANKTQYDQVKAIMEEHSKKDVSYYSGEVKDEGHLREIVLDFYEQKKAERGEDVGILVLLDHSLLVGDADNERLTLKKVSKTLQRLTRTIKCSAIMLNQLRDDIIRPERLLDPSGLSHFPTMNDIFGGRSSFHDSDFVTVIHRPEKLNIKQYGPYRDDCSGKSYLHFLKVRKGTECIKVLKNNLGHGKYEE